MRFKNRKGSALSTAIFVMFISVLLSGAIVMLVNSVAIRSRVQHDAVAAYYLALSGLEIGSTIVLQRDITDDSIFPVLELFNDIANQTYISPVETIVFDGMGYFPLYGGGMVDIGGGIMAMLHSTVEIQIYATNADGVRITTPSVINDVWVQVSAIARYVNVNGRVSTFYGRVRYQVSEPERVIWDIANPITFGP
ncbi:MAG: hypothetical protein FWD82_07130 [Defluviitaleaceae bacterium]|nr:hypothetical protein [Defluviitaleaceae bacterium]